MKSPSKGLRCQVLAAALGSVFVLTSCGGSDAVTTEETASTTTETVLTSSTLTSSTDVETSSAEPIESTTTTVAPPESTLPEATELASETTSPTTTSAPTTTEAPATTASTTTETTDTTIETPQTGDEIFANNCSSCHGDSGEGGRGPNLHGIGVDPREDHVEQVTNGGGGMPAWGTRLTPAQIEAVVDFVRTL